MSALTSPSPTVRASDHPAAPVHRHRVGDTEVVSLNGPLRDVAEPAHLALLESLADEPTTVLCDLSGVTGPPDVEAPRAARVRRAEVRQWPGTPLGVVCPAPDLRAGPGPAAGQRAPRHRRPPPPGAGRVGPAARGPPRCQRAAATGGPVGPGRPRPRRPDLPGLGVQRPGRAPRRWSSASWSPTPCCTRAPTCRSRWPGAGPGCGWRSVTPTAGARSLSASDTSQVAGRGMLLVAAVSEAWGVLPTE